MKPFRCKNCVKKVQWCGFNVIPCKCRLKRLFKIKTCIEKMGEIKIGEVCPFFESEALMPSGLIGNLKFTKEQKQNWTILLFYRGDFERVSKDEIKKLSSVFPKFQKEGIDFIGISYDSPFSHLAWTSSDKNQNVGKISFPLLSDQSHVISMMYRAYNINTGKCNQCSIIIDPNKVVRQIITHPNGINRSRKFLYRNAMACIHSQTNGWCDVNWEPNGMNNLMDL